MSQDTFEASLKERIDAKPAISTSMKRDKVGETIQLLSAFTDSASKLITALKTPKPLPQA